jgi:hypothetical protein
VYKTAAGAKPVLHDVWGEAAAGEMQVRHTVQKATPIVWLVQHMNPDAGCGVGLAYSSLQPVSVTHHHSCCFSLGLVLRPATDNLHPAWAVLLLSCSPAFPGCWRHNQSPGAIAFRQHTLSCHHSVL